MNGTEFVNDFSKEIYEQTYKFQGNEITPADKDIDYTHNRVAKFLASVEQDVDFWTKQFEKIQSNFAFMPGGRITSNAGLGLAGTTMINCFVDGFIGEEQDSLEGIFATLRRQGLILKSEGGYGFNSDVMRPRGAYIDGIATQSPGSVDMLDMWDTQSAVITKGSGLKNEKGKVKIRKGAQMVTKSMWHPDIVEFIEAKQTKGRLTKFNMSVLCDDDFMNAVDNNQPWDLKFPDYDNCKELYNKEWDGNIYLWESKGYPVKVYKTYDNANELWNLIMKSTYNRNEPGILFVSIINKLNNLWYIEYINATNPCGEQLLPIGGVCLLGSINLTQFITSTNEFDFDKFKEYIPIVVRMLDNVNDTTYVPLPNQRENLKNKRRVGIGVVGYGSMLLMMKKRFGSKEALELTDRIMSVLANEAYSASALLAKEKGSFPLFDKDKFLQSGFVKQALSPKTQDLIAKHGLRNSHLLSIQPTGNTSIVGNNISGGQECIFLFDYIRTSMQPNLPEGLLYPKNIDWDNRKFTYDQSENPWKWKKEGDEDLLFAEHGGSIWKFDKARGLLKESKIEDYGVWWLRQRGEWDAEAEWAVNAYNLSVDDHVNTMQVFAKYVDSAMSKTVNLPADYPYEEFKKLYMDCWKTGVIKGCTTYREGTMTTVLSAEKTKEEFHYRDAVKRPKSLPCEIHHTVAKGKKWTIIIGLYDNKPYEAFAIPFDDDIIPETIKKGKISKEKKGIYNLECDGEVKVLDIASVNNDEEQVLTRLISTALRHGSDIKFINDQLNKSHGTVISFTKAIARILNKYVKKIEQQDESCPECSGRMVHEEGCKKCIDCGYSACK